MSSWAQPLQGWGAEAAPKPPPAGHLKEIAKRRRAVNPHAIYDKTVLPYHVVTSGGYLADVFTSSVPGVQWVGFGMDPTPSGRSPVRMPSRTPLNATPPFNYRTDGPDIAAEWWDYKRPWLAYRPLPNDFTKAEWVYNDEADGNGFARVGNERYQCTPTALKWLTEYSAKVMRVGEVMAKYLAYDAVPLRIPTVTALPAEKADLKKQLSSTRKSMHEWMAFVIFLATHAGNGWEAIPVPVTGWADLVIPWLSAERVGTLVDFHLPRVSWPDIQELYVHGANPRYLWHYALDGPELTALDPRKLGAKEIAAVVREREKRMRKYDKNLVNLKNRTNELLRKDMVTEVSQVRRWFEQMDSDNPKPQRVVSAKRVRNREFIGCAVKLNFPEPGDGTVFHDVTDFDMPAKGWDAIAVPDYD
ncbi:hypothetical protein FA95DRAFT_1613291 [Auriscalpium vulgare]|uniref:Uncharacterized protein n=1 Tax=Auriscalpium vulgare TaxID=40419 RepID=A0ACB8R3I5_9AGAM|nr:hypothetical protein FA95DRAFT_1613291 [Auriscalpium vulgare]